MHPSGWITWAWPLILLLGLTLLSCATQVGKQPAILSDIRPRTLYSELRTVKVTYPRLSLHFEPNQGQTDEQVNFLSRGSGYTFILTSTTGSQEPLIWRAA